ncbi:thioesterase II family protein, partial [Streptomyces sp. NPDC057638]|uniref:thioesterase II family protein n=1 Tax=Streptomyces sp. NPDC057638 TaxID=3346190 RepID=UPI00369E2278
MTQQRWLQRVGPPPAHIAPPLAQLVCLPHAGGSPTFFRDWHQYLDPRIDLLAVCYPGRQGRFADPVITDMTEMAQALAGELAALDDRPLWLFGHSMGAAIGYESARILIDRYRVRPAGLLVSGFPPPHRMEPRALHREGDDAIVTDVLELGAASSALLAEPEFRELLLPAFRADYQLIETYRPTVTDPLDIPLTAYYGRADDDAATHVGEWDRYSTRTTPPMSYPGGHFYLQDMAPRLIADLSRRVLATLTTADRPTGSGVPG